MYFLFHSAKVGFCFLQVIILLDTLFYFLMGQVLKFCLTIYSCWISLIIICKAIIWFYNEVLTPIFLYCVISPWMSFIKRGNVAKLHKTRIFSQSLLIFPKRNSFISFWLKILYGHCKNFTRYTEWYLFFFTVLLRFIYQSWKPNPS